MAEIVVREANGDDAPGIARVHVRSWQAAYRGLIDDEHLDTLDEHARAEGWRRSIDSDLGRLLVATSDTTIVGFASVTASRDDDAGPTCGEVGAIYLDPDAWGQGIGRSLMNESLTRLVSDGFTEAILWVLDGNERAIGFYERCGFQPDGATKTDRSRGYPLQEARWRRHCG